MKLKNSASTAFLDRIVGIGRDVIFGVEDSLVSTLGVISGIAGGTEERFSIILAGVVVIIVEALSMSAGSYLSAASEHDLQARRLDVEREAISDHPITEQTKLAEVLRRRGFKQDDIDFLVRKSATDRKFLLEELAAHDLGISIRQLSIRPTKNALAMGVSYLAAGIIPIFPYLFLPVRIGIIVSVIVTVIALFFLGFSKATITRQSKFRSGGVMALISISAAGVGFLVGKIVARLFGIDV